MQYHKKLIIIASGVFILFGVVIIPTIEAPPPLAQSVRPIPKCPQLPSETFNDEFSAAGLQRFLSLVNKYELRATRCRQNNERAVVVIKVIGKRNSLKNFLAEGKTDAEFLKLLRY